jgi:hypothetical protein
MKKILIPVLLIGGIILSCKKEHSIGQDPVQDLKSDVKGNARIATTDSSHIPGDSCRTDSCRGGGTRPRDTTLSLTGDQIRISPASIDSGNVSGLVFASLTERSYPCASSNLLTYITSSTDSGYTVYYTGVYIPGTCTTGQAQARSTRTIFPVQNGSHRFNVVLNGTMYTGSFTKTGNQYNFNWPYTSGVTISPLTIN